MNFTANIPLQKEMPKMTFQQGRNQTQKEGREAKQRASQETEGKVRESGQH
jgi:hypothetical protein